MPLPNGNWYPPLKCNTLRTSKSAGPQSNIGPSPGMARARNPLIEPPFKRSPASDIVFDQVYVSRKVSPFENWSSSFVCRAWYVLWPKVAPNEPPPKSGNGTQLPAAPGPPPTAAGNTAHGAPQLVVLIPAGRICVTFWLPTLDCRSAAWVYT